MIHIKFQDNLLGLKEISDKQYDLAIVDPPYGIKESSKKRDLRTNKDKRGNLVTVKKEIYSLSDWDNKPPSDEYFIQLKRVSHNQIIFGANYFEQIVKPFKTPRGKDIFEFVYNNPTNWIIWDKVNGKSDFNDYELAWTSLNIPTTIFKYMWAGMNQGKSIKEGHIMQGNKKLNEKRIHKTQKPVNLYKWLLFNYAKPGFKILDTHLGSGSIAIACDEYGYELIAFENNFKIYLDATNRYNDFKKQLALF
jgi:site-specific DNA-methyltransferase (adenine-specific)